jgi:hypothetical protein
VVTGLFGRIEVYKSKSATYNKSITTNKNKNRYIGFQEKLNKKERNSLIKGLALIPFTIKPTNPAAKDALLVLFIIRPTNQTRVETKI